MKPLVKWPGGKTKEFKLVTEYKPLQFEKYFEPFVGGGAIWFGLGHTQNVVSDNFVELIDFYNIFKELGRECLDHINDFVSEYNSIDKDEMTKDEFGKVAEKYYYRYRNEEFTEPLDRVLKFYLMRQLSFGGILRFNKNGGFNVPFGWYKKLPLMKHDNSLFELLTNTEIVCCDWKTSLGDTDENDFVFLDPPYTRKFQNYSPHGSFGKKEHDDLAEWFSTSKSQNMIILNKDEFTYSLYKDFIVHEYGHKYSIQIKGRMKNDDVNAVHFVAVNYEPSLEKFMV